MRCAFCLATFCALGWPVVCSAQTNSLFGGRSTGGQGGFNNASSLGGSGGRSSGFGQTGSLFGNSGFASSSMGGSGSGGNSMSGSGFGNSGFGNSGFGGSGFGNSGLGNSGLGGQTGSAFGNTGMNMSTGPFIGQNDNRGRQVGNRMAGQQGALGAMQALQGLGALQRGGGFNRDRSGGGDDRERLPLRPTQRIAFDFDAATPSAAVERVTTQFAEIAESRPELAGITFAADDAGNVVLRGTVDSKEAAQLAAALVRLEPGVRSVVNELTVADGNSP